MERSPERCRSGIKYPDKVYTSKYSIYLARIRTQPHFPLRRQTRGDFTHISRAHTPTRPLHTNARTREDIGIISVPFTDKRYVGASTKSKVSTACDLLLHRLLQRSARWHAINERKHSSSTGSSTIDTLSERQFWLCSKLSGIVSSGPGNVPTTCPKVIET